MVMNGEEPVLFASSRAIMVLAMLPRNWAGTRSEDASILHTRCAPSKAPMSEKMLVLAAGAGA